MLGHNYRMEGIQGAVLGVKLKILDQWNLQRQYIAELYRKYLADINEIVLPVKMDYAKHVYHLFVAIVTKRNELRGHLESKQIDTGLHYPIPLHLQPCFSSLGYKKGDFPSSELLAESCLSLPIFPEMTEQQVRYVADQIRSFYTRTVYPITSVYA